MNIFFKLRTHKVIIQVLKAKTRLFSKVVNVFIQFDFNHDNFKLLKFNTKDLSENEMLHKFTCGLKV